MKDKQAKSADQSTAGQAQNAGKQQAASSAVQSSLRPSEQEYQPSSKSSGIAEQRKGQSVDDGTAAPANEAVTKSNSESSDETAQTDKPVRHPDPTRYGDWEKLGRCIDF